MWLIQMSTFTCKCHVLFHSWQVCPNDMPHYVIHKQSSKPCRHGTTSEPILNQYFICSGPNQSWTNSELILWLDPFGHRSAMVHICTYVSDHILVQRTNPESKMPAGNEFISRSLTLRLAILVFYRYQGENGFHLDFIECVFISKLKKTNNPSKPIGQKKVI